MGLRPARCYRKTNSGPAYTRTAKRVVKKGFVKGVPDPRIRKFDMGNPRLDYKYEVRLRARNDVQIRHNALESVRISVNNKAIKMIGKDNHWFKVYVYPHHVLRENALLTGAGADRLQTGMKHAFGRPVGRAARVKKGKVILGIKVLNEEHAEKAKSILKSITPKLPFKYEVEVVPIAS